MPTEEAPLAKQTALPPVDELEWIDLTTDALVFGMIAARYANSGVSGKWRPPMPGWARELQSTTIVISYNPDLGEGHETPGGSAWTATPSTRKCGDEIVLGLTIVEHLGQHAGRTGSRQWWVPYRCLCSATLRFRGVRIA